MYLDINSVEISKDNGSHWLSLGQYITDAEFQYNKIWSDDSGRNLAGTMSGSLLGIFVKIVVNFKPLTKAEINTIAPYLDSAYQLVRYYDASTNSTKTMGTYTGDWSLKNLNLMENETFSCSFIATKRRS